jgi:hypothetical protein
MPQRRGARSGSAVVFSTAVGLCLAPTARAHLQLSDNQVLITRESSHDAISYATADVNIRVTRDDGGDDGDAQYIIDYQATGQQKASYRFHADPRPEIFEIHSVERTSTLCDRDMLVVTLREYRNIDAPAYIYNHYFIELSQPGKASDYVDVAGREIGGPSFPGILGETARIDCSTMPLSVDAK